jgi:hypothetical protein
MNVFFSGTPAFLTQLLCNHLETLGFGENVRTDAVAK